MTDAVTVPVENFCVSLSARDKRVELIGAFYSSERAANRLFDTVDNYQSRYEDFATQPA